MSNIKCIVWIFIAAIFVGGMIQDIFSLGEIFLGAMILLFSIPLGEDE